MADETTAKLADFVYLDYGRAIERRIAFDGDHGSRSERTSQRHTVPQDDVNEGSTTHSSPNTTITITGASFTTDEFKGMQLAVAKPSNGGFYVGTVQSNSSTTIVVADSSQDIINRIKTDDLSFVIYDFVDSLSQHSVLRRGAFAPRTVATSGAYHTAGEWTGMPSYSEGDDETTYTDSGADFKSYMVGWLVTLRVADFAYVEIVDVPSATTMVVKGDTMGLALAGDRYWLFAPPHVDPATGAMRGTYTGGTFEPECDTHYLWGLYRYQPPMVGYYVQPDLESPPAVYGNQSGTNQAGWYDAGARRYDPCIGRWTTPDPAMTPWANLHKYTNRPARALDPSGLTEKSPDDYDVGSEVSDTKVVQEYRGTFWTEWYEYKGGQTTAWMYHKSGNKCWKVRARGGGQVRRHVVRNDMFRDMEIDFKATVVDKDGGQKDQETKIVLGSTIEVAAAVAAGDFGGATIIIAKSAWAVYDGKLHYEAKNKAYEVTKILEIRELRSFVMWRHYVSPWREMHGGWESKEIPCNCDDDDREWVNALPPNSVNLKRKRGESNWDSLDNLEEMDHGSTYRKDRTDWELGDLPSPGDNSNRLSGTKAPEGAVDGPWTAD